MSTAQPLTVAIADKSIAEDEVIAEVTLASGERLTKHVEHAIGNLARPMTDRELEDKFRDQAAPVLGSQRTDELIAHCWNVDKLSDCRTLSRPARNSPFRSWNTTFASIAKYAPAWPCT